MMKTFILVLIPILLVVIVNGSQLDTTCNEISVNEQCYKEIDEHFQLTSPGKIVKGGKEVDVVNGYALLGSGVEVKCPDGTFA